MTPCQTSATRRPLTISYKGQQSRHKIGPFVSTELTHFVLNVRLLPASRPILSTRNNRSAVLVLPEDRRKTVEEEEEEPIKQSEKPIDVRFAKSHQGNNIGDKDRAAKQFKEVV